MSAVQTQKRGRPEKPPGAADWSSLPAPAIYLTMKSLLPAYPVDVFSAARVCRAWKTVFRDCRRDLLSSMPPVAVQFNFEAHPAITDEGPRSPPPGAARPWVRPGVLAASHGHLFVADNGSDLPWRRIFLLEAVAALTGEETSVIALPRIPFDTDYLALLLTAHPASPRCVVVALVNEDVLLCCRVGDRGWTGEPCLEEATAARIHRELCAAISTQSMVAVDGKIYAVTVKGRLLIAESFFPHLTVLDVECFWPEKPFFSVSFMVESDGDILCFVDDPDDELGAEAALVSVHLKLGAFRLDLPAQRWVRADAALGVGSRAFLLNSHGDCLSWEAGGSGNEGCVFARGWGIDSDVVTVHHMKHGPECPLEHHRPAGYARAFFLPAACYPP